MTDDRRSPGVYGQIIEKVFLDRYREGAAELPFDREDLPAAAEALGLPRPKNLGDVIYSLRYRTTLPRAITDTQPEGREWVIEGRGKASYAFVLTRVSRIDPNPHLMTIKIPEATPEVVSAHALSDEQALLAKVRYNRLIDVFLGLAAYSLQNHLRTSVADLGQIEIDEVYVGVDRHGAQYVIPVQAKGGMDRLSTVQTKQDIRCCRARYPDLICRPVSAQFITDDRIALFELAEIDDDIRVVEERHYRLVPAADIEPSDLAVYRRRASTPTGGNVSS